MLRTFMVVYPQISLKLVCYQNIYSAQVKIKFTCDLVILKPGDFEISAFFKLGKDKTPNLLIKTKKQSRKNPSLMEENN